MKMLLTSNGLCNDSIVQALAHLLGKPFHQSRLCFIPTAANLDEEDKSWLVNDLSNCAKQGFANLDIVDIAAVPPESWKPRFESADVLLFGGGRTNYLHHWMQRSGLAAILPQLLEHCVYVGISAGSKVTGPPLPPDMAQPIGSDWEGGSLNYVPFSFIPHMNSQLFPSRARNQIEALTAFRVAPVYALDDQSALQVLDGEVTIISEGEWLYRGSE
jgi:dipeptidase E